MVQFKTGEWVYGIIGMRKMTGYLLEVGETQSLMRITLPEEDKDLSVIVETRDLIPSAYTVHPDDIPNLIDLALSMKDKEWFDQLTHELSLWKSATEYFGGGGIIG
jgi:hypothetical protein